MGQAMRTSEHLFESPWDRPSWRDGRRIGRLKRAVGAYVSTGPNRQSVEFKAIPGVQPTISNASSRQSILRCASIDNLQPGPHLQGERVSASKIPEWVALPASGQRRARRSED